MLSDTAIETLRDLVADGTITSRSAILVLILGSDTASRQVGVIAEKLAMSVPRVSMVGVTLEKQGLVSRCVPASDLRKVSLALESPGYETARKHWKNLERLGEVF